MKYGSVCSGIEAATMAWEPLGWEPAWFAEIEKFPSEVLKQRHPEVKNFGDFTAITKRKSGAIDILVGGTPCQSFSVAGRRAGLDDPRGNLTLEFVRLAKRLKPRWIVWENVPGVLSIDKGRTFAEFLQALEECGYGWAYRVLDAQYFGVPQRRRRTFVVGYLGNFTRAGAVLFEPESLRGNPPPSRSKGKVSPTIPASGAGRSRTGNERTEAEFVVTEEDMRPEVARTLMGKHNLYMDHSVDTLIPILEAGARTGKVGHEKTDGLGVGEEGDPMYTLQARKQHAVAFKPSHFTRGKDGKPNEVVPPLSTDADKGDQEAVVFEARYAVTAEDIARPHANPNSGAPPAIAFTQNSRSEVRLMDENGGIAGALPVEKGMTQQTFIMSGRQDPDVQKEVSPPLGQKDHGQALGTDPVSQTLNQRDGKGPGSYMNGSIQSCQMVSGLVRRLTPIECERLQGFPVIEKNVTIRVLWENYTDHQKKNVHAEETSLRLQKSVSNAEEGKSNQHAKNAVENSKQNHQDQDLPVALNVLIDFDQGLVHIRSQEKLLLNVNIAETKNLFPLPTGIGNFAQLVALTNSTLEIIIGTGKVASQKNSRNFIHQEGGKNIVSVYGPEIKQHAEDVGISTTEKNGCSMSTISGVGKNSQNSEQTLRILCCYVLNAISSFIPEEIKNVSSFDLNLKTSCGYTRIAWRGKGPEDCPDGPRYGAIGNSMAVPVMKWIGERIQMVEDIINDSD